jgi:DNA recombination protein RmuC
MSAIEVAIAATSAVTAASATVLVMHSRTGILRARLTTAELQASESRAALATSGEEIASLRMQHAEMSTRLECEREAIEQQMRMIDQQFKAVSADALKQNNEAFLDLAKVELEKVRTEAQGDLEKRQLAIGQLVKPIESNLEEVNKRVVELDKERGKAFAQLRGQMEELQKSGVLLQGETQKLTRALRQPVGRGRWGEIQLQTIVELAGMVEHCDFNTQAHVEADSQRLRPDMIVRLPNKRAIIVDSKVPLDAFLDATSTEDEAEIAAHMERHASHVRKHVKDLASKDYTEYVDDAPEFVVLFLPGDHFLSAALQHDPSLLEDAARKHVMIATPVTLLSTMRAVHYGWKQERLAENAAQISQLGRELFIRICKMGDHFAGLGKHLDRATKAYNETVGSLERRVLSQARKMKELDAAPDNIDVPEMPHLEESIRPFSSPEIVDELSPLKLISVDGA